MSPRINAGLTPLLCPLKWCPGPTTFSPFSSSASHPDQSILSGKIRVNVDCSRESPCDASIIFPFLTCALTRLLWRLGILPTADLEKAVKQFRKVDYAQQIKAKELLEHHAINFKKLLLRYRDSLEDRLFQFRLVCRTAKTTASLMPSLSMVTT